MMECFKWRPLFCLPHFLRNICEEQGPPPQEGQRQNQVVCEEHSWSRSLKPEHLSSSFLSPLLPVPPLFSPPSPLLSHTWNDKPYFSWVFLKQAEIQREERSPFIGGVQSCKMPVWDQVGNLGSWSFSSAKWGWRLPLRLVWGAGEVTHAGTQHMALSCSWRPHECRGAKLQICPRGKTKVLCFSTVFQNFSFEKEHSRIWIVGS